jgi:chaperonin GroEL
MKRAMDKITLEVVSRLKKISRKIQSEEDIIHIATISANNDKQIGRLVAEAVSAAGKNGAITIEESKSNETSLDLIEGFQLPGGYIAGAFVTDKNRATMRYEKPYLLVCDSTVEPLVIVANNVEGQALAALIMNTVRGSMKVAAIKVNQYGEQRTSTLKDLAIATGATLVSPETGLELKEVKLEHLGMCKSIDSTKTHTTVVGGTGDRKKIEEQIQFLSAQLEQEEEQYEAERIQDRITRLASGVAVIKVGGNTEVEMIEKKHRIEDALAAIRSARDEGIVPGGGTALVKATAELTVEDFEFETWSEQCGWLILKEAFEAPVRQMATNAGMSPDTTIQKIKQLDQEDNLGVNFLTGEVVNMYDEGIIDPCKVTKNALQNAVSAAGTLMTTGYAIVELEH